MMSPVADVELGPVSDLAHWQAVTEARQALGERIAKLITGADPTK